MKSWVNRKAKRPVPKDITKDLQRWMHVLDAYEPTRLIPEKTLTDVGWIGDASTSYGLGVIIAGRWVCLQLKDKWRLYTNHKKDIAWMETAAIRVGLIILLLLGTQPGRTYFVDTDNTTTEAVWCSKYDTNFQFSFYLFPLSFSLTFLLFLLYLFSLAHFFSYIHSEILKCY
jgi:hypothetical protein